MTTLRSPQDGSLVWEDDASAESRFRRVQQVSSPSGRSLPGMPPEMQDPEDDAAPRRHRGYEAPRGPWWRPASTWGRVLLGLVALIVAGGLSTAAYSLDKFLEHDARFRIAGVGNIQASGLSEVSRAEILPVFGEDVGKNIFFVHLNERRRQLEQIPWIEHATVMRLLPDQLRVSVVERTPIAFVRTGQQIELVDADGVLLSMPPSMMMQRHYSFPVVTGIDPHDALASRRVRMAVYQRLMNELDSHGQRLSDQISEIDLTDPEDARVLLPEQGADILAHFGDEQFFTRYQRYKTHIAEWRQQYPSLTSVDLRYEQQVVLQMNPGSGAAPAAVNAGDSDQAKQGDATAEPGAAKPGAGKEAKTPSKPKPAGKDKPKPSAKTKAAAVKEAKKRADLQHAAVQKHSANHEVAPNRQGQ